MSGPGERMDSNGIGRKVNELQEFIAKYIDQGDIPIKDMAAFLGWKDSTLRTAIEYGNFPAVHYKEHLNGRTTYKILPLKFYFWMIGGNTNDIK